MDEEQQGLGQAKRFDLLTNPFSILDVDLTASLQQIAAASGAAAADQVAGSNIVAARDVLANPRHRMSAELSFLLDAHAQEIRPLLAVLKADTALDDLVQVADRLPPLSRANLLAHVGSRRPASAGLLSALVEAHAGIEPKAVFTRLEAVRKTAGIAAPSFDSAVDGLRDLLSLHAKAVISQYPTARASAKPIEECTKRILASADPDRIEALEGIVGAFGARIEPALRQIEEQISSSAEMLQARPDELGLIYSFASNLRRWMSLARPLVELDTHKGRDEGRARQLFVEIRDLSIDFADSHSRFDVALSISEIAADVFKSLPRAAEQLSEDRATLAKRSAEIHVLPLRRWIEEFAGNPAVLVRDLEHSGFGRSSARKTKELWNLFTTAAETTQQTEAADLPWMMIRRLATDLTKDDQSLLAAKAILDGMVGYAQQVPPSEEVAQSIQDDLQAIERNIREEKLADDRNTDRRPAALSGIYQFIKDPRSPKIKAPINKAERQWEGWRAMLHVSMPNISWRDIRWRAMPYIKWGVFALVGALALFGSIPYGIPYSSLFGLSSTPPSTGDSNSPGTLAYNDASDPTQADNSAPDFPAQRSQLPIDEPPVGTGNMLSQANIRYCLYQKERMKVMGNELRGAEEVATFNTVVGDYNSRCGNFRYRENDLRVVTDEVNEKSEVLAAEGRDIVAGWRAGSTTQPSLATLDAPSSDAATPRIPSPMVSDRSANRMLASAAASADIDLLQLETAINAQKRLAQLGYFRGPINGTWGPQSRNALRSFKTANGLPNDDALDRATAARLHSAAAARSTSFAGMAAEAAIVTETPYPPPPGATLNPLNRSDAIKIHARLRELGFYRTPGYMLWSTASRDALKEFKTSSGLGADDQWDAATEAQLMSATPAAATPAAATAAAATPARVAEAVPAGFTAATNGVWSTDTRACPGGAGGSDALPLKITQNRAETEGARCEFGSVNGLGTMWKTRGTCTVNGQTRKANISLVRTGNVLVWSSENGTTKYQRCAS
jgi:peptidoglycan hydrolase-like protein with peptidoglycan-binding domain